MPRLSNVFFLFRAVFRFRVVQRFLDIRPVLIFKFSGNEDPFLEFSLGEVYFPTLSGVDQRVNPFG